MNCKCEVCKRDYKYDDPPGQGYDQHVCGPYCDGKRAGLRALPAWHDKPTCAGWWLVFRTELRANRLILVKLREPELSANESCDGVYCYGPVAEMPEMVAIPNTEGATT